MKTCLLDNLVEQLDSVKSKRWFLAWKWSLYSRRELNLSETENYCQHDSWGVASPQWRHECRSVGVSDCSVGLVRQRQWSEWELVCRDFLAIDLRLSEMRFTAITAMESKSLLNAFQTFIWVNLSTEWNDVCFGVKTETNNSLLSQRTSNSS